MAPVLRHLAILLGIGIGMLLPGMCPNAQAEVAAGPPLSAPPPTNYSRQEDSIPKKPSAPLPLVQRKAPETPHCERYFVYQGKKLECDSQLGSDAERLRPIVRDVPAALAELEAYQRAQKEIRVAAYVGTLGLASAIIGGLVSQPLADPDTGGLKPGAYMTGIGIALAANALIYGLSLTKVNETRLGKAVEYYNAVHPENPVQLQFSTQVHF